jgi:hypothetical protein
VGAGAVDVEEASMAAVVMATIMMEAVATVIMSGVTGTRDLATRPTPAGARGARPSCEIKMIKHR